MTREPWRFSKPEGVSSEVLADVTAALDDKRGAPFRRSRHATTWKVPVSGSGAIFVKRLDGARGPVARTKAMSRVRRSVHVLRISRELRRDGFRVPDVLLIGENRDTGEEVIVTSQASGFMLTRWMNPLHRTALGQRREILRALGAEIARLHLSGYVHGDLTPYNIFATSDHPVAITFIDHEGTEQSSRVSINLARNRMRNLVQLGHGEIPGVSRTDRLRVFKSYADAALSGQSSRQLLRRLVKMIERRRTRDRALRRDESQTAIIAEEGAARG